MKFSDPARRLFHGFQAHLSYPQAFSQILEDQPRGSRLFICMTAIEGGSGCPGWLEDLTIYLGFIAEATALAVRALAISGGELTKQAQSGAVGEPASHDLAGERRDIGSWLAAHGRQATSCRTVVVENRSESRCQAVQIRQHQFPHPAARMQSAMAS